MNRSRSEEVKIIVSAQDQTAGILGGLQKQVLGLAAAYMSFNVAKDAMSYIVKAGMEAEAAWNDVSESLRRHGFAVDYSLAAIQRFSYETMRTTGETDEAIGKSIQTFIDYGATIEQAQRRVTVALDLAAGQNMSLEAATFLLAKASQGATETLTRYGIVIDDSVPKAERLEMALQQIEGRFGGAAEAKMDTMAGKTKDLGNAFDELSESIYRALGGKESGKGFFGQLVEQAAQEIYDLGQQIDLGRAIFDRLAEGFEPKPLPVPLPDPKAVLETAEECANISATLWDDMVAYAVNAEDDITVGQKNELEQREDDLRHWVKQREKIEAEAAEESAKIYENDLALFQATMFQKTISFEDVDRQAAMSASRHADDEERAAMKSQEAWGYFSGEFVSLFNDMEATTEEILASMANAFIHLLFNTVLASQGGFVKSFLSAFRFWDVAENDAALVREGQRAAMFIQQGMTQGMNGFTLAPALAGGGGANQRSIQRSETHYHFGNVFDAASFSRTYLPTIERSARSGRSRLAVNTSNVTGGPNVVVV